MAQMTTEQKMDMDLDQIAQEEGKGVQQGTGSGSRVYVGNLAYSVTWKELKDHMGSAGNCTFADVLMDYNGRSKGCGIVEFEEAGAAKKAIETLTNTELNGRPIFVREDREPPKFGQGSFSGGQTGRGVFVNNLPYRTSWQDLKDAFRDAGEVVRADILIDSYGHSRGQGTVLFETADQAKKAIERFNNSEFAGRQIQCRQDKFL